jgi:hypothetical protein
MKLKTMHNRGLTLIEVIIYVTLFTYLMTSVLVDVYYLLNSAYEVRTKIRGLTDTYFETVI